jgi:tetratricopeptide (TPR) repeat protein
VVAASLPVPSAGLPVPSASLPVPSAGLPVPSASLPVPSAGLPVPSASLPVHAPSLPSPGPASSSRGFGEIDFPGLSDSLPNAPRVDPKLAGPDPDPFGSFGEIDLPHDAMASLPPPPAARDFPSLRPAAPQSPPPPPPAQPDVPDFGDIELGGAPPPRTRSSPRPPPPGPSLGPKPEAGGMGFGEVDLGVDAVGGGEIGLEASAAPQATEAPLLPQVQAAATARISLRPRLGSEPPPRSLKKWFVLAGLGLLAMGGGALQLTPYGAFGYLVIGDRVHAADYVTATTAAVAATETTLAADTFDAAKSAVSAAYAAHARTPRARQLAAYSAFVDLASGARFGADPARAPRAKQVLADLLPPNAAPQYLDAALAAQAADAGEIDKARGQLKALEGRYQGDPVRIELALLQGEVDLAAGDATSAVASFGRALSAGTAGTDARPHFGLARAYDRLGKGADATKEIAATLAASPTHPGALILRARRKTASVAPAAALRDLTAVIEGPAKVHTSPMEASAAYAAKAWVTLERGGASEARDTFEQAIKLDSRNVDALDGVGRLLTNEGRYTEALARFDTALQVDTNAPEIIADDAEAKVALERLADAKQQLTAARERFPKNTSVLLLLAKTEQHLGNNDAAETILKSALALVDPTRADALRPYVAMSELLSARGRLVEARDMLEDAKKKLPASSELERAFADVSELQGDYDGAIGHYKAALARDPHDVVAHFRLGVALRRVRKFDEASAELDQVAAVDKDYPGLSLERGVLYEESGDVQKAIELFKGALAKAPDDPDLQLRVGSAYVAIGRADDAMTMLRKVLEQRPTSAEAHHYMGRALMAKDAGSADALRYLKRAVELDPNRAEFHVYLAWAANEATPANLELAHDEVEKALALDKVSAEAYWQRAVLERVEGAIDDAIKDAKHALELRPSRYEAHATLAECYDQKNDTATATAEWAKAIAGDAAVGAEEDVLHPYWRFKYGKLLADRGGAGAAAGYLVPAVKAAEKMAPRPGWLAPLEFSTAEVLRKTGKRDDAVGHYKRFLEIAPLNSPDRLDAQHALAQLAPER